MPAELSLNSPIESQFARLDEAQKNALAKLGIKMVRDLLYHFPTRYGDTSELKPISSLEAGELAVVFGTISKLKMSKGFRTKIAMADAEITDTTGTVQAVWFHQPYIAKMVSEGATVRVEGKLSRRVKGTHAGSLYFSNPKIEIVLGNNVPIGVGDSLFGKEGEAHSLYPVYPESRGITSNWLYHGLQRIFKSGLLEELIDPIPKDILDKYHLPSLKTALIWIHAPQNKDDALSARKRFAFEEIFFIQLKKQQERKEYEANSAWIIEKKPSDIADFTKRFPFEMTAAQNGAIETILADMGKGKAMSRLLEGDVGSGKTAVAAATVYAVTVTSPRIKKNSKNAKDDMNDLGDPDNPLSKSYQLRTRGDGNLQTAYMVPTEILAKQHYESFIKYFRHMPISIALITGSGCQKFPSKTNPEGATDISRAQLLKWVASGEISILIGTHALIQKAVKFKNLGYVIIDEQHRFGTMQRKSLVRKDGIAPHLLSMTATPIPRTLALTIYGDLDLSLLDQMPTGRKPIITQLVLPKPKDREATYEKIRTELQAGRQLYVICPRINEADPAKEKAVNTKSVTEEADRLRKKVFPEYTIGILHSKMTPDKKDEVMADFAAKKIDILVATSVVEVGVNVPNATIIIIEGAERFGLAQLHQLRGRVIRSNHQAYCYLFADVKSEKTLERLKAIQTAKNGFELSEKDLALRGIGELYGRKQWGLSDIAMEAIQNIKMVEVARTEATRLIDLDSELTDYPLLRERLESTHLEIHLE